jgi:phosphatidylserine/phosphatidylglycerophosphate/cardiolipin synthase-like enzyme
MIDIYFSGEDVGLYAVVRAYLLNAKKRIWLEMFNLCSTEIIDLLKREGDSDVDIRMLLDYNNENEKLWIKDGKVREPKWVKIRFGNPNMFWTYHLKMAIVDDTVLFGSANWSYSGMIKNREGLIVTDEPEIVKKCEEIFSTDWDNGLIDLRKAKKASRFFGLQKYISKLRRG